MSEPSSTHASVEVHSGATGDHASPNVMEVSSYMMGLTWITFILVTVILYKVAWKPILAALEKREEDIRKAVDQAAQTREELGRIEETRRKTIAEADAQAREIVDTARRAAVDVAQTIEGKAREESQILLENAQREIRAAQEKAIASLRKESADLALVMARKVIGDSLDEARSRALTDKLIKEV